MAAYRNLFVAYARPGAKTEEFSREVLGWRKPVYTVESDSNAKLIDLGAKPARAKTTAFLTFEALGYKIEG